MRYLLAQFTRDGSRLVAEASDLGLKSVPQTLYVKGASRTVRFLYSETERDREGEALGWVYLPDDRSQPITSLLLIND